ncbi:MAG: fasciclin domain-containing protein, partial [Akkermansiaceae bacterium]
VTVLAPTDAAFAALPKGTVEELLKSENRDKLTAILSLHAIPGKVSAGDALNAGTAKALSGGSLKFDVVDGLLKVNGATIVKTDIKCDNGVIHVIDAVILSSSNRGGNKTASASGKTPLEQIEAAIDRGVPIFNSGEHGECASIYRDCMVSISEASCVDSRVSMVIKQLVQKAGDIESDTERAWVLRSGLDHVYTTLSKN